MSNLAAASQTEEEKSQEKSRRSEDRTHNSSVEESLGISLSGFTMSSDKTQDQEFADVLESVMENNFQDNSEQTSAPTRLATPLHWAVAMRSEKVIDELIKFGADIDALDNFQRPPLICAADINSARIVKKLVYAGADTSCYDEEDYTALVIAVQHGNLEMIRYLEGDNMSIDTSNRMGATVLNAVNDSGIAAPKMFSYFLSKGVDPHRRGMKTMGPVTGAFKGQPGYVALGVYILNTGLLASVDESDNGNPLAQVVATCGQDVKLLKMIFRFLNSHNMCGRFLEYRSIEDSTALCNAAIAESIPCLDILLQMGADINREGCVQGSPIMAASHFGRIKAVKRLFRSGALTSYTSEEGIHRNAFTAGRHHRHIRHWFLLGRFQDQYKLTQTANQSTEGLTERPWSGPSQVEWRLSGDKRQRRGESGLDYFCRLQHMKTESRGLIVV